MVNMSAKFDKETCNGVVFIVFTGSTDGRTDRRTHARTHGTTAALLYPHRNALRGDNKLAILYEVQVSESEVQIMQFDFNVHVFRHSFLTTLGSKSTAER